MKHPLLVALLLAPFTALSAVDTAKPPKPNFVIIIRQETERTLGAALGQNVFRTYQKYNGKWLESNNPPPGE